MNTHDKLMEIKAWIGSWEEGIFTDDETLSYILQEVVGDPNGNFPDREELIPTTKLQNT